MGHTCSLASYILPIRTKQDLQESLQNMLLYRCMQGSIWKLNIILYNVKLISCLGSIPDFSVGKDHWKWKLYFGVYFYTGNHLPFLWFMRPLLRHSFTTNTSRETILGRMRKQATLRISIPYAYVRTRLRSVVQLQGAHYKLITDLKPWALPSLGKRKSLCIQLVRHFDRLQLWYVVYR